VRSRTSIIIEPVLIGHFGIMDNSDRLGNSSISLYVFVVDSKFKVFIYLLVFHSRLTIFDLRFELIAVFPKTCR
jgi:hypothetical protein